MKRIMLFGLPGSGKSTAALELSDRLQLSLHHLDKYFFIENWAKRDYDDFLRLLGEMVSQESWIIDGNCMRSLEMRFERADTAIYFCFPVLTCLWRVLKRRFQTRCPIDDRAEGCGEALHWNLIWYLICYKRKYREKIELLHEKYPDVKFIVVKNDKEVRKVIF